jgi:hypothetical protein
MEELSGAGPRDLSLEQDHSLGAESSAASRWIELLYDLL